MARIRALAEPPAAGADRAALGKLADAAVRLGSADGLPADLVPGFEAVAAAFRCYEAGRDDDAREAVQGIGLQSPFLEWKVFLRGLAAHAAGDSGRAVENWQRLAADRLPARLAAPLRAALDPAFRAAQTPDATAKLARQFEKLSGGDLLDRLRAIQKELGRDKPLTQVWRHAEAALPLVRRHRPHLEARLAGCLYRAIVQQGEQPDLDRYRKLFGPPADDPQFLRLQALVCEQTGQLEGANRFWAGYEAWLAGNPPGWPDRVARRARAFVSHRMGQNAAKLRAGGRDRDLAAAFEKLFRADRGERRPPPRRSADPEPHFRRAADLAPDWPAAAVDLFRFYRATDQPGLAEDAARALLRHRPDDIVLLEGLADLTQRQGRTADALGYWKRALAANPLDRRLRGRTAHSHLAAARQLLLAGRAAAAWAQLQDGEEVCRDGCPVGFLALSSVAARKLGRGEDANRFRAEAGAIEGGRLAAAFVAFVDGTLAKLKPADKAAAKAALTAALTEPPTPLEVDRLYAAWDGYRREGITYRGQPTHEKAVQTAALRSVSPAAKVADLERLGRGLAARQAWPVVAKFAARCRELHPDNPAFRLFEAEGVAAKGGMKAGKWLAKFLDDTRRLAERSADPRHHDLLPRIDELRQAAVAPDDLFEFFFGGRG